MINIIYHAKVIISVGNFKPSNTNRIQISRFKQYIQANSFQAFLIQSLHLLDAIVHRGSMLTSVFGDLYSPSIVSKALVSR